jgi:DNA-binding NarL/FixJ family response regulator
VRVSLVGGLRVNRDALAAALDEEHGLRVAASGAQADVVVVDAASAQKGLELVRGLRATTDAAILVLGAPDAERDVISFAELGVAGFVERDAPLDDLVSAVVTVAGGEGSVPPRIAGTLLRGFERQANRHATGRGADLTMRERQVVDLIEAGLTNKEIAAQLFIELGTVKNHVHNILDKLQVSRRAEAVAHLRLIESDVDARAGFGSARHVSRHRAG